jgi:hypothetical protein
LGYDVKDTFRFGICKTPVAASLGSGGFTFDVLPGHPEESILIHRLRSTQPKIMMPELGRTLAHEEGIELMSQWIRELKEACQQTKPVQAQGSQQ